MQKAIDFGRGRIFRHWIGDSCKVFHSGGECGDSAAPSSKAHQAQGIEPAGNCEMSRVTQSARRFESPPRRVNSQLGMAEVLGKFVGDETSLYERYQRPPLVDLTASNSDNLKLGQKLTKLASGDLISRLITIFVGLSNPALQCGDRPSRLIGYVA